jgi:predicted ATP-grasp superfamily ATP-dependent carboligase
LISVILSLKSEKGKTILIPVDDFAASTIDENIDLLKADFLFPNIRMEQGAVNRLVDKNYQKLLARQAGLNVAEGWVVNIENHQYTLPNDIKYPVFPKPQISFKGNKSCMRKCNNERELRNVLDNVAKVRDCPMLLEQYCEITKEYALLGFSDGKEVIIPAMIQMLESGSGGHHGVTLKGKIFNPDDFVFINQLKQFMQSLHFCGLFDIDAYESNGKLYFNELNLRFGASGYAMTNSGINLPDCFIKHLTGRGQTTEIYKVNEAVFVNEKVAYDDFYNGFISLSKYKKYLKDGNFGFIKSDDDPKPYNMFISQNFSFKKRLKREIKYLLRCFS